MRCRAQQEKMGQRGREDNDLSGGIVFPNIPWDEVLPSWKWLNISLLTGNREFILCLALLAQAVLLYTLNCLHPSPWAFSPHEFSHFSPSDSLPSQYGNLCNVQVQWGVAATLHTLPRVALKCIKTHGKLPLETQSQVWMREWFGSLSDLKQEKSSKTQVNP